MPLSWLREGPADRLVLFDLDDTLVEHRSAATTALIHAIEWWSPHDGHLLDRPESHATFPSAVTRITSLSALAASLL